MNKITLFIFLLSISYLTAQTTENISFETSEGFTLDILDGQDGWGTTDVVDNQIVVTDDESTDGSNSLFIEGLNSPFDDGQGNLALVGAFSPLYTLSGQTVTLEFDIYLTDVSDPENDASDVAFQLQSTTEELITSRIIFDFQGNISVVDNTGGGPAFEDIGTFNREEWISVRMVHNFDDETIEYLINDNLEYTGSVWNAESVNQIVMLYDNFDSGAYIDNITLSDDPNLSNNQFVLDNNFVHFTINNTLNLESTTTLNEVEIFNLAGKRIIESNLNAQNNAQIDITSLNQGIYIARLITENGNHSFKFAK